MKKRIYVLFILLFILLFHPVKTFSEEKFTSSIKDFSYEILYPENQSDKNLGYYDLLMKPGEEQKIQLQLNNTSDQPMLVTINLNSAKTNGNGVIEYGPSTLAKDDSLKIDLSEIMKGPKEVTIPAKSSETVTFTVSLPLIRFDGYLAGGIQLKPVMKETKPQNDKNMIQNKFAFLIGVLISEQEVKEIKPELKLNTVSLKLKDGGYSVFVNISNLKGVFVENMTANVQITEKGKNITLFELKREHMRMAPNTMIDLPISLDNHRVKSNDYTANIQIKTENGGNWTWIKNFNLSKIEAKQINSQVADSENHTFPFWWLIIIFLPLLVGGYIILRKKISSKRS
ncbi:DUF916 and DUF3324 domain-containing protein [Enterococcus silesiacus]|nr:DUF916 and DUF3324 domain-containing protein [Enterococcus silesiacus]